MREDWQGRGIGTILVTTLIDAARSHGIAAFTADVLADNHGMIRVLHKCGFSVESELQEGVYRLRIPSEGRRRPRRARQEEADQQA